MAPVPKESSHIGLGTHPLQGDLLLTHDLGNDPIPRESHRQRMSLEGDTIHLVTAGYGSEILPEKGWL